MGGHILINLKEDSDPTIYIELAAEKIKEGKIVIYPTDTVYGIGTDPFNEESVRAIFDFKRRDYSQGLPILVADIDEAKKIVDFNRYEEKLAEIFWPGEVTIVLDLKKECNLPRLVTGGQETVALRVPQNPIALGICRHLKKISDFGGIIGTSANISGEPSFTDGKKVAEEFGFAVDYIITTGKTKDKIPSTIVRIEKEKEINSNNLEDSIKILREGKISKKEIIEGLLKNE
ncbi:MAG: L-threonylcarbamoyladenylate synthase [Promethearchaeota archaeon]